MAGDGRRAWWGRAAIISLAALMALSACEAYQRERVPIATGGTPATEPAPPSGPGAPLQLVPGEQAPGGVEASGVPPAPSSLVDRGTGRLIAPPAVKVA